MAVTVLEDKWNLLLHRVNVVKDEFHNLEKQMKDLNLEDIRIPRLKEVWKDIEEYIIDNINNAKKLPGCPNVKCKLFNTNTTYTDANNLYSRDIYSRWRIVKNNTITYITHCPYCGTKLE